MFNACVLQIPKMTACNVRDQTTEGSHGDYSKILLSRKT